MHKHYFARKIQSLDRIIKFDQQRGRLPELHNTYLEQNPIEMTKLIKLTDKRDKQRPTKLIESINK